MKLKDISSIDMADTPTSINHDNQTRYISVTAGIDSKHNIGLVSKEVQSKLDSYKTPNGYEIEMVGETESINQAISDLVKMIALAIAFIYLIMVAQFQSLLSPFIVMFTIPLYTSCIYWWFISINYNRSRVKCYIYVRIFSSCWCSC